MEAVLVFECPISSFWIHKCNQLRLGSRLSIPLRPQYETCGFSRNTQKHWTCYITRGRKCCRQAVSVHQTSRKEKPPIHSKDRKKVARNHLEP